MSAETKNLTEAEIQKLQEKARRDANRLPLFVTFAFDRVAQPKGGGWDDVVYQHNNIGLNILQAHRHYKYPNVSGVQVVNRFSGTVVFELREGVDPKPA